MAKYDYDKLVELSGTIITSPLPEETWQAATQVSPFLPVPTAVNLRSLSLLPGSKIKPHKIMRSGTVSGFSPEAIQTLHDQYRLVKIFDLRRDSELLREPYTIDVPGVTVEWIGQGVKEEAARVDLAKFDGKLVQGYIWMYETVLVEYKDGLERVFAYLRDNAEGGILFHCYAGKDRTGVLAALLLELTDHDLELIAQDYALTRVGLEAQREVLMSHFLQWFGPDAMIRPGVLELASCEAVAMIGFMIWLRKQYGSTRGWLVKECGWAEQDVEILVKNITV